MVAYSFKKQFEVAIALGLKRQTIRGFRSRHARPGEMLQLFVAMRTAHCHKICDDVLCTTTRRVVISFDGEGTIEQIMVAGAPVADLDAFAREDGFADLIEMEDFWHRENSPVGLWHGVLIEWEPPSRLAEALE